MLRRALWAPAVCALLAAPAAAQPQNDLLDVFTVQVKPDKMAQFDAACKKIVAANRQNKGSDWVALAQEYGQGYTVRFISTRASFAAIEESSQAFMAAMNKAYGKAASEQIFRDVDSSLVSSQSEIRRRRWELSSNVPADPAAMARLVGEARWVQTTAVHARPGQGPKVEEQLQAVKAANEKAAAKITVLVSQAAFGQTGTVYYVTTLRKSLGEVDSATPLAKLLGEDGYAKFLKVSTEAVVTTEPTLSRMRPEWSNPAEPIVAAAPDFWRPKAVVAAKSAKEPAAPASPKKEK
jgi:quinol monooxygenase YgiN